MQGSIFEVFIIFYHIDKKRILSYSIFHTLMAV